MLDLIFQVTLLKQKASSFGHLKELGYEHKNV